MTPLTRCVGCEHQIAQVCDECRRACALKSFSGISRHPESGTGCLVCEDGPPAWCGMCWVEQVATYRGELRGLGHDIGRWPDYPMVRREARHSDTLLRWVERQGPAGS